MNPYKMRGNRTNACMIHYRKPIRLQGYDYSGIGSYFITICTFQRAYLFGEIQSGNKVLNDCGAHAKKCWAAIPEHYPNVSLDEFVVMPNHIHGIIKITDVGVQDLEPLQNALQYNKYQHIIPKSIGSIVRGFKSGVTKWSRNNTNILAVWQRNYWEHVIRDDFEFNRIRKYVQDNIAQWEMDSLHDQMSELKERDVSEKHVWVSISIIQTQQQRSS